MQDFEMKTLKERNSVKHESNSITDMMQLIVCRMLTLNDVSNVSKPKMLTVIAESNVIKSLR